MWKNPNDKAIDPYQDLVLNKAAWADVPQGQYGPPTPFFNDFRAAHHPDEQLSRGRQFRFRKERPTTLSVRAEFFNVSNRRHLANPAGSPTTASTFNNRGQLTGGFGYIAPTSTGRGLPRSGQLVARFPF